MKKRGVNHEDTQLMNRELIFGLLRDNSQLSRSDLAELSGLRPATISNIVSDLIAAGLVEEAGTIHSGMGRRPIELRLIGEGTAYLIHSFAPHSPALFHVSLNGTVQHTYSLKPNGEDSQSIVDRIVCCTGDIQDTAMGGRRLHGIGVIVDSTTLAAMNSAARDRGYDGADEWLGALTGVRTCVAPENYVCALAARGDDSAAKPRGPVVYISVGRCIEAAVHTGDQKGLPDDMGGNSLAHLCINFNGPPCACGSRGCLTLYASTEAIRTDIGEKRHFHAKSTLPADPTAKDIADGFLDDEPLARSAVITAAGFLAIGLDSIIRLLRPAEILLGGDIPLFGEGYLAILRTLLRKRLPCALYESVVIRMADNSGKALLHGMFRYLSLCSVREIISCL